MGVAVLAVIAIVIVFAGGFIGGVEDCSTVDECYGWAMELMSEGDFEGAVWQLQQALDFASEDEHPPFAHLWCELGIAYFEMEQFEDAITPFETCVEWTEGNPELEDLRVSAEEHLGELYNQPVSELCSSVEECYDQAMELRGAGDPSGAEELLHRALDFVSVDERPPYAYLWCELGGVYLEIEQIDDAVSKFEVCIEWTEGLPELEELRLRAQEQIQLIQEN